jgi:hypothetical protein
MWAIGSIAADNIGYRDQILANDGMEIIVKAVTNAIDNSMDANFVVTGCWAITKLCQGKP